MKNRSEVIQALVSELGFKESSFNNTPTNSSREKYWTFNRLLGVYYKEKKKLGKNER